MVMFMQKILFIIIALFGFSHLSYADDWIKAFPRFDINQGQEYQDASFRGSYVEYRICTEKDDKVLEINIHDQIVRSGYFYNRILNNWLGTYYTGINITEDEKILRRVLTLVSQSVISVETSFDNWPFMPNFALLDSLLGFSGKKVAEIAEKFKAKFPAVKVIRFWTGFNENALVTPHHVFNLSHVTIRGGASWVSAFKDIGIDLQIEVGNED
jgi:hypothetical protein